MKLNRNINETRHNEFSSLRLFVSAVFIFSVSFFFIFFSQNATADSANKNILIVFQKSHGFRQQLIDQLQTDLSRYNYHISNLELGASEKISPQNLSTISKQQLLIAIGSQTTKILLDAKIDTPILSALIPRHISKSLKKAHLNKNNWSCLLIDQPFDRQFNLISAVLGKNQDTGILLGPYTADLQKTLKKISTKTSHKINFEKVKDSEQLSSSLKKINRSSDVLLTLPDPSIYNKGTLRGILLSAYRNKLPIIGFSKAYVNAGAIAAVYSEPKQISKQITQITKNYFIRRSFKKDNYYPDEFSVALNKNIAHSLGIKLSTNENIVKQIKKAEEKK